MKKIFKKIIRKLDYKLNGGIRTIPIFEIRNKEQLMKNKVVFITGGSGGIGFEIAKKVIDSGGKVILSGTNEKKLEDNCKSLGENSKYIVLNLYNVSEFQKAIDVSIKYWDKIDVLINCAGIHDKHPKFLEITEENYDKIIDLNFKATYFMSQTIAKYFLTNKIKGHILNISSQSELEPAWSPYRLSKWGVKGITQGFAQVLLENGIVVNSIAPGPTATGMQDYNNGDSIFTSQNPIERYTMPSEVAEYAILLMSDLGNTIIGDTIYMSGGRGIVDIR